MLKPLLFAVLGGIISKKAGVINLGTEGIMLIGAVMSCIIFIQTENLTITLLVALLASAGLGFIHAFLCISLQANQIVSGLAITLFGTGLSAYIGKAVAGVALPVSIPRVNITWFETIPMVGKVFSNLDIFIWVSIVLAFLLYLYMYKHLGDFGGLDALGFRIQLIDSGIPSYFRKMIPYVATIHSSINVCWMEKS